MTVFGCMRAHVVSVGPEASLREVVDVLSLYQLQSVGVVDAEGVLLGAVSEYDVSVPLLLEALDGGALATSHDSIVERASHCAHELMDRSIPTIEEDAPIEQACQLMAARGGAGLFVTRGGRFVGMVGLADICEALLERVGA